MGKIAFVFAGQGAQYSGMGKDLYENSKAAKAVFDMADNIREGLAKLCFEGDIKEISITKNTQPALFAVDLACAVALLNAGIIPDGVAGFSLGEIAALGFSGILSYEDAFELVCKRGEYMHISAEKYKGAMVAILRMDSEKIENLCKQFKNVFPVNYNCPGQIVVAGDEEEIENFIKLILENGGKAIKLLVSGAFHSPFMNDAADKMSEYLNALELNLPKMPVYSNKTAKPYEGEFKKLIVEQIKSPVKWQETIENMINDGYDTFIEVGAGKTLSGLIKKISSNVRVFNVENNESLQNTIQNIKNGG